jgi:hypothetical protein
VSVHTIPPSPAGESDDGKQEDGVELGVRGEPHAQRRCAPQPSLPALVALLEGEERAQQRERAEERDEQVVRHHRRPGEIQGKHDQEQGGDEPARTAGQDRPERVHEPDPERRHGEDGADQRALREAEETAGAERGQPPREAVGHVVVGKDASHVDAPQEVEPLRVVTEAEPAEPGQT